MMNVTALSASHRRPCSSARTSARRDTPERCSRAGTKRPMNTAASPARAARAQKGPRQPVSRPAKEPTGTPMTLARVRPPIFQLAGKPTTRTRRRGRQKVQPQLQRVLDDLTATPAIAQGRRGDILAWNALAAALITDFSRIPGKHRNHPRNQFTDPAMRTLYADWEASAQISVAQLRMEAAKYPDAPRLIELVGELSTPDEQFAQWWGDHRVAARTAGTETLNHAVVGELVLDRDTPTANTDPDQHLTVWTAEPGSPTHERLRVLTSWAADQNLSASQPARRG